MLELKIMPTTVPYKRFPGYVLQPAPISKLAEEPQPAPAPPPVSEPDEPEEPDLKTRYSAKRKPKPSKHR